MGYTSKQINEHRQSYTSRDYDRQRRSYHKDNMVDRRSSSRRRSSSVSSRSALRSGRFSGNNTSTSKPRSGGTSRYLENAVVAFEDFGEAQTALKLYEFRDKIRTPEKLKKNVVVQIEASTVSTVDVLLRRDLWHQDIKHPCKTGCDLVGRIVNAGNRCEDVKIGDRVCAIGLAIGGNAKYAILPASRVFCCPEDIHPTKVACLVRNYMAAYQCLHRAGGAKIRPGNKILIIGGAGALGQALIQLSVAAGADEIYATGKGSTSKRIIENLGAQALGRKPGEWLPYVKGEMDIVIDSVCTDDYVSSHRALNRSGKLVCVGSTALVKKDYYWNSGMDPKKRFYAVELSSSMPKTSFYDVFSSLETKRDVFRKDLFRLFHLCRNHEITPKVAFCITLDEVANAHLDLEAGGIDGNIICLPFGPEGKKINSTESEQDLITEYDDGVQVRQSLIGGSLPSMFGKVMKDGTFKVLNKHREEYDDDMYSRVGGPQKPSSRGGLRRVDSTPFGIQDDMDRSYHRGMLSEEDDDEGTRFSTYSNRNSKPTRHEDDNYNRSGLRGVPRPRQNSSRRDLADDPDDYLYPERKQNIHRHRGYDDDDAQSVRSKSRMRGNSRSGSRRSVTQNNYDDNDDDARSTRSRSRTRSTNPGPRSSSILRDIDDDARSMRSRSTKRRSSREPGRMRSSTRDLAHDDNEGPGDYGIKRTASILRNGNSHTNGSPSHHASRSSRARSSSRSGQPVPRARSRSRDPQGRRNKNGQRGRTRSRSQDSRSGGRSPSAESAYSQSSRGTQRSEYSVSSSYTKDSEHTRGDVSVATSVASRDTEYTAPEIEDKERSSRKRISAKKISHPPKPKPVVEKIPSKRGLFSRLRSKSRPKVKEDVVQVIAKPSKSLRRISSKIPATPEKGSRRQRDNSKDRHAEKHKGNRKDRGSSRNLGHDDRKKNRKEYKGGGKVRNTSRDPTRDRDRRHSGGRKENKQMDSRDDYSDEESDEYYEEDEVRSVVPLNCASGESLDSPNGDFDGAYQKPRHGGGRSSSIPRPALKQSRNSSRSERKSSASSQRRSSSRPHGSRSSRARSSSRSRYEDEYY